IFLFASLILSYNDLLAQNISDICAKQKGTHAIVNRPTIATPEEDQYDVTHLAFDIALNNTNTDVSGNVITTAKVVATSMAVYAFELSRDITLDSVKVNNVLISAGQINTTGDIRKVTLNAALPVSTVFKAQVYYHGTLPNGSGFFTRGLNQVNLPSGTPIMYTLSDPFTAQDWWPSKQSLQDKIDSVDMWVTVPATNKAGSNGLLKNVTAMPGGKSRYEWKTKYPIDYYLISVAVAPYGDYSYYMHYTDGSGDSMLIQNYVYDSLAYMPANKKALDTTGLIVDYFSKLFGRYPFDKEKYGHCIAQPLGGGMEHQTMTTLAFAQGTLIAHELGHQWWGDHVTNSTWADVWLSEGFASYTEQLFVEHFQGGAAFKTYRTNVFNDAMSSNTGSVYVDDTTDANRIFDGVLTYRKGASVVHMLRYLAPKDEDFFTVLKNYQQQHAFGFASTENLKDIAEQVYGVALDTFFDQWIYKEGFPRYGGKWYQDGNQFYLQINQTTSAPSSIAYFTMPLEINLRSDAGDTVIKVYNNAVSQNYSLSVGRIIKGITVDPNNHVLNKASAFTNDPTLSVTNNDIIAIAAYPNPSNDGWKLNGLSNNMDVVLADIAGAIKWKGKATASEIFIPSLSLPAGNYICTIITNGADVVKVIKLSK
ncbi:MAG: T9SS type A sorting domain-containing protein, partial [Sphingobacteriales bacterium]